MGIEHIVTLKSSKKGEMGVAALIIFIALILVVTIAAGVLLQSSMVLQQKGLETGSETLTNVATHISVLELAGYDGRNDNLMNYTMIIKISPGSDPVVLSDTLIDVWDTTFKEVLTYVEGDAAVGEFNVTMLQKNSGTPEDVLARGDVARVHFALNDPIYPGEKLNIGIDPKQGTHTHISITTPYAFSSYRVPLYP